MAFSFDAGGYTSENALQTRKFPKSENSWRISLTAHYLVATERRKNRSNPTGRINGWKQILNILTIHYGDRIEAAS